MQGFLGSGHGSSCRIQVANPEVRGILVLLLKTGLITSGSGVAAIVVGMFFGFGPCNSTYAGIVFFFGGALAVLVGCVILLWGIVFRVIERFSHT